MFNLFLATCSIPKLVSGQCSESGVAGSGYKLHFLRVHTIPQAITSNPTMETRTISTKL